MFVLTPQHKNKWGYEAVLLSQKESGYPVAVFHIDELDKGMHGGGEPYIAIYARLRKGESVEVDLVLR